LFHVTVSNLSNYLTNLIDNNIMENPATNNTVVTPKVAPEVSGEYTDHREVHILRKENTSLFHGKNERWIQEGKHKIGSSINGAKRLVSDNNEMSALMPRLVGISNTSPNWETKLNEYFDNLAVNVPETGLILEVGFKYPNEDDFDKLCDAEDKIDLKYAKADKSTADKNIDALRNKWEEIITLENTRYKYGTPINLADYILWRYCLVYSDVANDVAFLDKSPNIRFYIFDKEKSEKEQEVKHEVTTKALRAYIEILGDQHKVDSILYMFGENITGLKVIPKQQKLETLVRSNPNKFLAAVNDKHLMKKAFINECLVKGVLHTLTNTNIIVDADNNTIGHGLEECIAFIDDPRNKATYSTIEAQLKALPKE
jgi:hypothetical protein